MELARLIKNTLAGFVLQALTILVGLLAVPILLRAIGDEGYGIIGLATTISAYVFLLGGGVPAGTTKYIAQYAAKKDWEEVYRLANTSILFFGGLGLLSSLGLLAAIETIGIGGLQLSDSTYKEAYAVALYTCVSLAFSTFGQAFVSIIEGLQEHRKSFQIEGLILLLRYTAGIVVAWQGGSISTIYLVMQCPLILRLLLLGACVKRLMPEWSFGRRAFSLESFKRILSFSVWLLLIQIAMVLTYQTDNLVIASALPVAMITAYQVALKPFELVKLCSARFSGAVMPAITERFEKSDLETIQEVGYKGALYSNLFTIPLAATAAILSAPFLRLWVGPEYLEYAWIAQAACLFQIAWQSNSFIGQVALGLGHVRGLSLIAIGAAVFNVMSSLATVRPFGLAGVIGSTLVAGVLAVCLQYLFVFPELGIRPRRYVAACLLRPLVLYFSLNLSIVWIFGARMHQIERWVDFLLVGSLLMLINYGAAFGALVPATHRRRILEAIRTKLR